MRFIRELQDTHPELPHGEPREAAGSAFWQDLIDPRTQATTNDARTDRGFTGHEHIDRVGIVHMNGRLYGPLTGRMLSADPIVQEPYNLRRWWVSRGSLGAFGAGVLHGIGGHFAEVAAANRATLGASYAGVLGTGLRGAQFATQIAAHAMAGGVISVLQGGKFGHSFVSAGATKAASPWINSIGDGAREMAPARVASAALVGGTVSAATGGKLANGAVTAAFQQAWNGERGLRQRAREAAAAAQRAAIRVASSVVEADIEAAERSLRAHFRSNKYSAHVGVGLSGGGGRSLSGGTAGLYGAGGVSLFVTSDLQIGISFSAAIGAAGGAYFGYGPHASLGYANSSASLPNASIELNQVHELAFRNASVQITNDASAYGVSQSLDTARFGMGLGAMGATGAQGSVIIASNPFPRW